MFFVALITGSVYLSKRKSDSGKHPPPKPLPVNYERIAHVFSMSQTDGDRLLFKATAQKAVDFADTGKSQLEDVEIFVYGKTGDRHDRITTHAADYDSNTGQFYADGEVLIEVGSLPGK